MYAIDEVGRSGMNIGYSLSWSISTLGLPALIFPFPSFLLPMLIKHGFATTRVDRMQLHPLWIKPQSTTIVLFYTTARVASNSIALCDLGFEAPITRDHDTDICLLLARICIALLIESNVFLPSEPHLSRQGGEEAIGEGLNAKRPTIKVSTSNRHV